MKPNPPKPPDPIQVIAEDPYANQPKKWIGCTAQFLHQGQSLVGIVTAQRFTGRTIKGNIPDYALTIRGKSGKTLEISLVENKATLT
jgi:hypothetical protein